MKRIACTCLMMLCVLSFALSQPVDSLWSHGYGGSTDIAECYSLSQTSDGGYILGGVIISSSYDADYWLVKTNSVGSMTWSIPYTMSTSVEEYCYSAIETSDNGFLMGGFTASTTGASNRDIWIVKTYSAGGIEWSSVFDRGLEDICYDVIQLSSGEYVFAGLSESPGSPSHHDFWLAKLTSSGNEVWNYTYGGAHGEACYSLALDSDEGFLMAGHSLASGNSDFLIIKTNSSGDSLWSKSYGGSETDKCQSVIVTADGGYAMAGWTESYGNGGADYWLVRLDTNGDTLWTHAYGGNSDDYCFSVVQVSDGGYVLAGQTYTFGTGTPNYWMVRTDSNGHELWNRTFGTSSHESCRAVLSTDDGGYALAGWSGSIVGPGSSNFWLVKTGPDVGLCGSISGTLDPGTYHVTCPISVEAGDTLVIQPGTTFDFLGPYPFEIRGTLLAQGTETDSICFTTDTLSNPDRWRGLRFYGESSSGSLLDYNVIEFGNAVGSWPNFESFGGGVYCDGASPVLNNCLIRSNESGHGGGVYTREGATPQFIACT
ncbi:hypothetical protein KKC97_07015, partial [bacterium]|nr:hypothetical protein [bacterium]